MTHKMAFRSIWAASFALWTSSFVWGTEPVVLANDDAVQTVAKDSALPELPKTLTSFGAVVAGKNLIVCGGHIGTAHTYSKDEQSDKTYVLDLSSPSAWKEFPTGQNLQGLGLVAYKGKAIRIGGFAARNAEGEDQVLETLAEVAKWDDASQSWKAMPNLPQPRSSHDAAVVGDRVYVCGGWTMQPGKETQWHKTMEVMDLSQAKPEWKSVEVPFVRRALATLGYQGKLYCVGGMNEDGGPTTEVSVYDPANQTWTEGPKLPGEPIAGFGVAIGVINDRLMATTVEGNVLALSQDGKQWEKVGTTPTKRFFHRLVTHDDALLVLGGGNMASGKFTAVEAISVHGK